MFRKEIGLQNWALIFLSAGGLLLHLRIHPPANDVFNNVPVLFGVLNVFVMPFLFNSRKTVRWAYMFNLLTVAVGTVTMAYYSFNNPPDITFTNLIVQTTLADILILGARVPLGQSILNQFKQADSPEEEQEG